MCWPIQSQNFIFQKIDGNFPSVDNALALVHHQKALRLARELLSDSTNHTSNEAVGTIVSFTCHHVSILFENDTELTSTGFIGQLRRR